MANYEIPVRSERAPASPTIHDTANPESSDSASGRFSADLSPSSTQGAAAPTRCPDKSGAFVPRRQTDYWNGYKFRPDDVVIAWRG